MVPFSFAQIPLELQSAKTPEELSAYSGSFNFLKPTRNEVLKVSVRM